MMKTMLTAFTSAEETEAELSDIHGRSAAVQLCVLTGTGEPNFLFLCSPKSIFN